jgi:hypothetical protein
MDPKDFNWTEDQQVTVTNPTAQDYKFKVHGKEYQLGAGKSAKMPGYIAWVYVYDISTQLAQADGVFNRWNEEGFRRTYYEKLVIGTDDIVQAVKEEPEPQIHEFEEDNNNARIAADTPNAVDAADSLADDEEGDSPDSEPTKDELVKVKPMSAKAKDGRVTKV